MNNPNLGANLSKFQPRLDATSPSGIVDADVSDEPSKDQDKGKRSIVHNNFQSNFLTSHKEELGVALGKQQTTASDMKPVRAKRSNLSSLLPEGTKKRNTAVPKARIRATKGASTFNQPIDNDPTSKYVFFHRNGLCSEPSSLL